MGDGERYRKDIEKWRRMGYDVSYLEASIKSGNELLDEDFEEFKVLVMLMESLKKQLDNEDFMIQASIDREAHQRLIRAQGMIHDVTKVDLLQKEIDRLKASVSKANFKHDMEGLLKSLDSRMKKTRGSKRSLADEVFLVMHKDGRLLAHATNDRIQGVDEDILAGMMTATQEFVNNCLRYEEGALKAIEYGNLKLLIEPGQYIYLAAVFSEGSPHHVAAVAKRVVQNVEKRYGGILADWDGDTSRFKKLHEIIDPLVKDF